MTSTGKDHDWPTPSEDAYWVVIVDRGTGAASVTLFEGVDAADRAHETARQWETGPTCAVVVGKR